MWNDDDADIGGFVGVFMLAMLVALFRLFPLLVKAVFYTFKYAIEIGGVALRKYIASQKPPVL